MLQLKVSLLLVSIGVAALIDEIILCKFSNTQFLIKSGNSLMENFIIIILAGSKFVFCLLQ